MSDRQETANHHSKRYKDGKLLHEMYVEQEMSTIDIADELDCAPNTVRKYLKENGIEIRSRSAAVKLGHGHRPNEVPFGTHENGPEVWWPSHTDADAKHVYVHRLVAVAEYGFGEVADSHIHHKNEIRWDNRPGNLVPMEPGDHSSHHTRKVGDEVRREIAERYHETEDSSYTIAEDYPIGPNTVMNIYREYYGDENGGEPAI